MRCSNFSADAIVFSLGVEARKRLTIGVELASKPELLLFLDEPTSGLDTQSAWNIVRFLRKLADSGQAILCTIHQPYSFLFESFDRLLLLQRGGETVWLYRYVLMLGTNHLQVYFGDIGPDAAVVRDYFGRYGAHCPDNANPAEYMLEAIGAGLAPRVGGRDWAEIWLDSPECKEVREEIQRIKAEGLARPINTKKLTKRYATPFLCQLKAVASRACVTLWRSPDYVYTRLFMHVDVSSIVSLSFLQSGNSVKDLQSRVFAM
jgi:ATP-binding cassette subfamily G (WHITE) protein 2 (SNQ2)